jgi:N-acetylglucosaminyldiphosphoundecaprenol N-acetyl-beta-D-mannosaminyltransferase
MDERFPSVRILGTQISCVLRKEILQTPVRWAQNDIKRTMLYANAHCLNMTVNDPEYLVILNKADMVYADGISIVWASRFLGGCALEKTTGRDWIYDFCSIAEENALRIFILAGKPGIARRAAKNLAQKYPGLIIAGTHNGYLDNVDSKEVAKKINAAYPDVLLVGMGTPLQEKWLATHRELIEAPVCWAVGALFDYVAGEERPVPTWLNRLNLEWLWRLWVNPAGKWRRYLIGNPLFLFRIIKQKWM